MFNGERLRKLRIEKGLTQQELGDLINVTKADISMIENNKRSPKISSIIEFMMIFNVSSDYLLGADSIIKEYKNAEVATTIMTKEEIKFIEELKKNKLVYDILLEDPLRGVTLINKKIG
ncbi:MAG: helix-turn-helix transcriptional regulator [Bacilli bacterium]|nr:helix-turn-helix transcriptional regulator [Bacilli bacterium]